MLDFPASPTMGQAYGQWLWDGVKWTQGNVTATTWPFNDTGRNLIHNGRFEVAQRGAGPWTTLTYTLDRWLNNSSAGGSASVTQITLADADRAAIGDEAATAAVQVVFTGDPAAGGYALLQQNIETVRRLGGKTVTISYWARATAAGVKIAVELGQYFGSGGSPSASTTGTGVAATLATSWARYSATVALPSTSGKTLGTNAGDYTQLSFWLSAGSNFATRGGSIGVQSGTIQLWGIQLETGTVATPLAKREYGDELRLCQRYYQAYRQLQINAHAGAAGAPYGNSFLFPVTMRAAPTIAFANTTYGNASGIVGGNVTPGAVYIYVISTAVGGLTYTSDFTASADL